MKYLARTLYVIVIHVFISANVFSQNDSVKYVYDFDSEIFSSWNNFYDKWFPDEYYNILKKYHIKLNCSNCEYAYLDVDFYVADCKLVEYKIIKQNFCSENAKREMINELLEFFLKNDFPEEMKDIKVRVRLGTGLKC